MIDSFQPNIPQISAEEVYRAIGKENFLLLDVRTSEEYQRGKIRGSINIPLLELSDKVAQFVPDKDTTIYVYCLSGSRSTVAVSELIKIGYKKALSMTSGLLAWRGKQYPLE